MLRLSVAVERRSVQFVFGCRGTWSSLFYVRLSSLPSSICWKHLAKLETERCGTLNTNRSAKFSSSTAAGKMDPTSAMAASAPAPPPLDSVLLELQLELV